MRRSEDAKMALGKLHLYALAKRLHPDADFDVREGSGGLPGDREKAARAGLEAVFGQLVDSNASGAYHWCRGPALVVCGWELTQLGTDEYNEERERSRGVIPLQDGEELTWWYSTFLSEEFVFACEKFRFHIKTHAD